MSRSGTDRNLLFGILALQLDFIDKNQLVAGMNAWALAKTKPIGQIFVEQGVLTADRQALLESIVREHLKLHGDDPGQSLAAVKIPRSIHDDLSRVADPGILASSSLAPPPPG